MSIQTSIRGAINRFISSHIIGPEPVHSSQLSNLDILDGIKRQGDTAEVQSVPCPSCGWPSLSYQCFTECSTDSHE